MAYAIAYLRLPRIRGGDYGTSAAAVLSPKIVATGLGLIGTAASVAGNEGAICFGRQRLIATATLASILIVGTLGFLGSTSYALTAVFMTFYGIVFSSSFTA
jgi:hypothetical protein